MAKAVAGGVAKTGTVDHTGVNQFVSQERVARLRQAGQQTKISVVAGVKNKG